VGEKSEKLAAIGYHGDGSFIDVYYNGLTVTPLSKAGSKYLEY
jgi:hypothetical protein